MSEKYLSSPEALAAARTKAWETRRARYGQRGHKTAYSRLRADGVAWRAVALIVRLYNEGTLSGGQCSRALDIGLVDWRELVDRVTPDSPFWKPADDIQKGSKP